MASPTMETFCCVMENGTYQLTSINFYSHQIPYNVTSIAIAILAMFGGIYQLLPRQFTVSEFHWSIQIHRQRHIINWLALADCLAALGLLVRSLSWILLKHSGKSDSSKHIICAVTSGWTQFFYTATYFWNLSYAVDIYRILHQKNSISLRYYHLTVWGISIIICAVGLGILYYPKLKCSHDLPHILPNYLCSIFPLILVMFTNPLLYFLSSKQVKELLFSTGMITQQERRLFSTFVHRFFKFVTVFYMCWLPNIINSVVLWSIWPNLSSLEVFILTLWYMMAILNPLQAVFNAFVYTSSRGKLQCLDCFSFLHERNRIGDIHHSHENESAQLLDSRTKISNYKTSINDTFNTTL